MATEASTTESGTTDGAQSAPQDAQASTQATNTPPTTPTPADLRKTQEAQDKAAEQEQAEESPWRDPQKAHVEIERLRRENAKHRTSREAERQEADAKLRAVLKAAGIDTGEDADEDPLKAASAAREKAETEARQARVELAVHRAAPAVGGDAAALLDSRSFLDRLTDLDPSDQDAITGAIRDAIKDTPRLASTQAAARSSADFTGGTGDSAPSKYKPGMSIADGLAADGAH
ncbi:hypothetical protein [Brachybacterium kimchii]|uniref:Scaffolding protein n=1 Tax=Brachybacterium kimchii TaxID=2942909 RepID=A0ABY4N4I0_9MICO|nr:hypothetical protein [Brachybacterium kimchii]UQN29475.1 hypothetical protein M4486_17850 [Brachybacterium kimchii]